MLLIGLFFINVTMLIAGLLSLLLHEFVEKLSAHSQV